MSREARVRVSAIALFVFDFKISKILFTIIIYAHDFAAAARAAGHTGPLAYRVSFIPLTSSGRHALAAAAGRVRVWRRRDDFRFCRYRGAFCIAASSRLYSHLFCRKPNYAPLSRMMPVDDDIFKRFFEMLHDMMPHRLMIRGCISLHDGAGVVADDARRVSFDMARCRCAMPERRFSARAGGDASPAWPTAQPVDLRHTFTLTADDIFLPGQAGLPVSAEVY